MRLSLWLSAIVVAAVVMVGMTSTGRAAGGARTLVLLHAGEDGEDAALAQAVRIYTRDLDYGGQGSGEVVPEITPEGLGRVIAFVRAAGVRMAFWFEAGRRNEAVLYAVGNVGGRVAMNALRVAGL